MNHVKSKCNCNLCRISAGYNPRSDAVWWIWMYYDLKVILNAIKIRSRR